MTTYDKHIKIALIGDAFSGKSTFAKRICYDEKDVIYNTTIGIDTSLLFMNHNDKYYKIQFFDTTGHLNFIKIVRCYYKGCDAYILFFDITNRSSFEHIKFWLNDIEEHLPPNIDETRPLLIPKILIGTKPDIRYDKHNFVRYEEAKDFADTFGLHYYEISCINDELNTLKKIIRNTIDEININNIKDKSKSTNKSRYNCCTTQCTIT